MGCGVSAQKAGKGKAPSANGTNRVIKTFFGTPDMSLVADVNTHRVHVRPAFVQPHLGTAYLLSAVIEEDAVQRPSGSRAEAKAEVRTADPAQGEAEAAARTQATESGQKSDAGTDEKAGPVDTEAEQPETKTEDNTESKPEAMPDGKPEETVELKQEAKAAEQQPVDYVRWGIYNDSGSEVRVTSTFFHAESIVALCKDVLEERLGNDKLRATITVPAGKTMLYVEGPIVGYLWKCEMRNTKGAYEGAYALELA